MPEDFSERDTHFRRVIASIKRERKERKLTGPALQKNLKMEKAVKGFMSVNRSLSTLPMLKPMNGKKKADR